MNTEAIFSQDGITAVSSQIQQLKTLFPACFDKGGRFLIDKFQAEIAQQTDISREFYAMDWLGKSYARLLRNLPPETLISEDKTHNAKPENAGSQNLLIRGDNLEVLKHLKNAYAGSVKMIYIDPPYNTGSDDFVYQDDRKFTPAELARLANIDEDEAARILDFTDKGSNSHSAWLTFMYPRLYIARELLKDDGVIFISIDDHEQAQLKLLCDEVFGAENFVAQFSREAIKGGSQSKFVRETHDYILCYAKNIQYVEFTGFEKEELTLNLEDEKGKYAKGRELNKWGAGSRREDSPSMWFPIYSPYGDEIYPIRNDGSEGRWRMGKKKMEELVANNEVIYEKRTDGTFIVYEKLRGNKTKFSQITTFLRDRYLNASATEELKRLFEKERAIFDFSKPYNLVADLIQISESETDKDSKDYLILDFFSGSGTTAHAVMQLNAEEQNGSRRYICVQLPEKTDEKSEARKAGYPTIFDITKARIEKAAAKIRAEHRDYTGDLGFKIFQTVENFRQYPDNDFSPDQMDFPFNDKLSEEQLQTLLTTWTLYDGAALTTPVESVRLGSYTAYLCEKRLYLMNAGFTSADLLAFIRKLDDDAAFNPNRVIVFGSNMASAMQHELDQAVRGYTNKKEIELNVIIRV